MKTMKQKKFFANVLAIGFALFSMFFGAGNVIFPPFLGLQCGRLWFAGFAAYYAADVLLAVFALFALYAGLKPYPEDYDANGKLLVDGAKMANDTFKSVGWCAAFLIGWILERRFVRFSTDVPAMTKIVRLVTGLLSYYAVSLILVPLVKGWIPGPVGTAVSCALQMFYVSFLFPCFLRRLEKAAD